MVALGELVKSVRRHHPNADSDLISRAYEYAEWAHRDQKRKSGDPYFVHPASVAGILADLRLDPASVCAGLLHDVVEDTSATFEELADEFGLEIADLVDGVTKLTKVNFNSREDRQAESFRKMVMAMAKDLRVLLVKLCDRLDNMRSLEHMKTESQERIARETMEIYAPLANRLGMHKLKSELEDLSLKYLEPDQYQHITKKLSASRRERERYIDGVAKSLKARLAEMGFAAEVSGGARHITSIYRKMQEHHCRFEQVFDITSFTVRVESEADCYATLGVVHSRWTPIPGRFKDYIALTKPNRYQSLHTAVVGPGQRRLEIRIRTNEMNRVAEVGVAAHWYTDETADRSGALKPEDAARFKWLKELATFQNDLKDPAEFFESVKIDLFPDEVYAFTPKGDVKVLPRGASVLDFAYSIHSEVGDRCSGGRANGQPVPPRYKIRSGDLLEITTAKNVKPSKDWVDFCVTSRAKNHVRSYLRSQHRMKSVNLGRELFETEMRAAGLSYGKFFKNPDQVSTLIKSNGSETLDDLLLGIGYGKVQPEELIKILNSSGGGDDAVPASIRTGPLEKIVDRVTGRDHTGIRVNGADDTLVRYARCCNALAGDPIIGFITRGRGVTVHRRDCAKAFNSDPERRVDVSWGANAKGARPVSLKIVTQNTPGILATVGRAFSAQKINLTEAICKANEDGTAQNEFTFTCNDLAQLKTVMRALVKVKGVVAVERT
ncbi:MAG: bifunctional (p)ppGpp synthetase/guanosine-3',5'-bis(diphosphate) 3'-pyrophosphohydrolase [Polyangiaceae bacterium]|nr:bifunctional (p)ppGpp synthetase/guanosine-3',5'-bis(diphosphate) 3'-pyrophosphohydrolase [Polyangiaceae bacterium]